MMFRIEIVTDLSKNVHLLNIGVQKRNWWK